MPLSATLSRGEYICSVGCRDIGVSIMSPVSHRNYIWILILLLFMLTSLLY